MARVEAMFEYEKQYSQYEYIGGIDEVGRGPLAGPVVTACVIMPKDIRIPYDENSGIDERIIRAVREMGFEYMSPIQQAAIPVMMEGKDIIGQAQTGTGKTASFGIPLLQRVDPQNKHLQAVVLCPTRELAMQAADDIRDFAKYMFGIKVLSVYGGQDISRQIRALSNGVQIVVGTPGRVMDHMRRHTMKMADVKVLVLDEADEMLDMGFREDIETILDGMPEERQTALLVRFSEGKNGDGVLGI